MRFFLLLLWVAGAHAATYYVDFATGSDANNGTTTGTPWQHCPGDASATGNAASATPAAGDTINFKGGVAYAGNIAIKSSGSVGNVITYDGQPSGWGTGRADFGASEIDLNYKDYGVIKNIEFHGGDQSIVGEGHATLSQDHWTIYNCYFHDTMAGQGAIACKGDCFDITIDSCVFEYNNYLRGGDGTHTGTTGQNTVLTDSTKSFTPDALVGLALINKTGSALGTITANTATTVTVSAGMKSEGGADVNWTDAASYAITTNSGRGAIYFSGDLDSPGGLAAGLTSGNKVLRCTFGPSGDTPLFFFYQTGLEIGYCTILGPNARFHSNGITHYATEGLQGGDASFHHNYYNGERVWLVFQYINPTSIYVYNNVINVNDNVPAPIQSDGLQGGTLYVINNDLFGGANFSVQLIDTEPVLVAKNNILSKPLNSGGSISASNNCYTDGGGTHGETGSIEQTDLSLIFVRTALDSVDDFAIISGFAGKDAGMDASVYGVTDDYLGRARSTYDIGAYEYQPGTTTIGSGSGSMSFGSGAGSTTFQ